MEKSLDSENQNKEILNDLDPLYDRVVGNIKRRKDRIKDGLVNSLPWPFPRFSEHVVGLEKGKIYQVTAGPKTGKSKYTNYAFIYSQYDFIINNALTLKFRVKYFCLEESKESLVTQFMSYALFTKSKGKFNVSPEELMSTKEELPCEVLAELDKHRDYINGFLECVEYIEDIAHPFGIYKRLLDYAEINGTQKKKIVDYGNGPKEVDDIYIPNDPEELVLTVVDHVSLLQPKKGAQISDAITEMSGYLIKLRNKYGYSSVIVQQQALAQSSMEGIKFNQGEPTIANLGDSKLTSRAVDISFAIYSPFVNKIPEYESYDVKFYKDNIRFVTVLLSRHGGAGTKAPLYFNGAVNFFSELPKADTPAENSLKKKIRSIRNG